MFGVAVSVSYTKTTMSFATSKTLPFMNDFPIEKKNMLFESILPTVKHFKIEVYPLKLFLCFISFVIIWVFYCYFNNLHGIFSRSRFHLKKLLFCSHIRSNPSSVLSWDPRNSVTYSRSKSNSSSLAISTTSVVTSSTEGFGPLKVIHEGWNQLLSNSR